MRKIFFLSILSISLVIAAQAQTFVSVDDASKTALNVGAKMPEFTLNDSLGKPVSSKDLLKQGNLVVVLSWSVVSVLQ